MDRIIKLSQEEKDIIVQVRRKNFFLYVLPMSVGSMYLCKRLMATGKISTNYGVAKIGGAALFAYIIGKSFLPAQITSELYRQCPEGEFVKMSKKLKTLSPEERRNLILKGPDAISDAGTEETSQYDTPKTVPNTSLEPLGQQLPVAQDKTSETNKSSFSYAQQREKWNTAGTAYGRNVPGSSSEPSTIPPQPVNKIYGDSKPTIPSNLPDTSNKPLPQDLPITPSSGRKVRKNQYGDEME